MSKRSKCDGQERMCFVHSKFVDAKRETRNTEAAKSNAGFGQSIG